MRRTAGERRPGGRTPRRSGGAALKQSDPRTVAPPMTEAQRRVEMRRRAAVRKLAVVHAQVRVIIRNILRYTTWMHTAKYTRYQVHK